ncbi:hypothetical protein F9K33_16360 [bacterium]|nr:MAG: hypothetical protein F9K33_16360 [bacterium]
MTVECSHEQKGELFPTLLENSEEELNAFHNNPGSLASAISRLLLQSNPAGGVLDPAWGVYVNALSSVRAFSPDAVSAVY